MEHLITRLARLFISCLAMIILVGCSSEDPNPELKDPIYRDLTRQFKKHEKWVQDAEKGLEAIETEMARVEPRSLDRKIKSREYQKALKEITELKQQLEYYRIKAELRKVYGRKAYRIAYQKGEKWPNPQEFEDYSTNKRLREASRNWSDRVPKSRHQQISEEDMKKGSE